MIKEFREFVIRGNVVDLAIGVIIGGAFGKIISSLVTDIIMPPIGLLLHGVDFSSLFLSLNEQGYASLADAQKAGAPTLNYGLFISNVIDFLIVALVIFLFIRAISKLHKPAPAPAPNTKDCPYCFTSIPLQAARCPNCTSDIK